MPKPKRRSRGGWSGLQRKSSGRSHMPGTRGRELLREPSSVRYLIDLGVLMLLLTVADKAWADQVHIHKCRSISVSELQRLMQRLPELAFFRGREVSKINSNDIRTYLLAGNPHPAWMFPECFSAEVPEAALTYEWTLFFDDIFSYLNTDEIRRCNSKWNARVSTDMSKLRIWIDVFFIDQVLLPNLFSTKA